MRASTCTRTSHDNQRTIRGKSAPNVSAPCSDQSLLEAALAGAFGVSDFLDVDEESDDAGVVGVVELLPESLEVLDDDDSLDVVLDDEDDLDLPPRLSVL